MKKKYLFSKSIGVKEDEKDLYVEGFVAHTDPDSGNDIIPTHVQQMIVDQINGKHRGIAHKGSMHHDWLINQNPNEDVIALAEEAKLIEGKAWIRAKINKVHPDFEKVKHEISDGIIDSFSIEYADETMPFHYETRDGKTYRIFDGVDMLGYGLASRPLNSSAKMTNAYFKEIVKGRADMKTKEEKTVDNAVDNKTEKTTQPEEKKEGIKAESTVSKEDLEVVKKELKETKDKLGEIESEKAKEHADKLLAEQIAKVDTVLNKINNNVQPVNLPLKQQEGNIEKKSGDPLSKENVRKYIDEAKSPDEQRKRINEVVSKLGFAK